MTIDAGSVGPIAGTVNVPGDRRLTLAVLAFAMMAPEEISVMNPSPAPDVDRFMAFLNENGARSERTGTSIRFTGKPWSGEVRITDAVPEDILHAVAASAVFSAERIIIEHAAGRRRRIIDMLIGVLRPLGLAEKNIERAEERIFISGISFEGDDTVNAGSSWILESIAAAAAGNAPVNVSFHQSYASHVLQLMSCTGFSVEKDDGDFDPGFELERRLAKNTSGKVPVLRKLVWHGAPDTVIGIPGDVTIAAAVCGTAALVQRSQVTLPDVCWEQGRRGFFEALKRMKIDISWEESNGNFSFEAASIKMKWGRAIGIHLSSDQAALMGPELSLLGAVATAADGKSVIVTDGKSPLPDRGAFSVLSHGLERLGAHVGDFTDGIILNGGCELRGTEDMAMGDVPDSALALAVAGIAASGTTTLAGDDRFDYPVGMFLNLVRNIEYKKLI